ncbi:MAG: hypothetical protein U0905_11710 [Pirellulales bacterium]
MIRRTDVRWGWSASLMLVGLCLSGIGKPCQAQTTTTSSTPIVLTIQLGTQSAKILISTIGNCITLTPIQEGLGTVRVETPEEGTPPSPASMVASKEASEATADRSPTPAGPPSVPTPPSAPAVAAPTASASLSLGQDVTVKAEIASLEANENGSPKTIVSEDFSLDRQPANASPLLPADRPDWVGRAHFVDGTTHFISVGALPDESLNKSKASLDESILKEVRKYVNENILHEEDGAEQLEPLTLSWIKSRCLVKGHEYDVQFDSNTTTYHQAWVELKLSDRDRKTIEHWWKDIQRHERAKKLGGGMAVAVAGIGVCHLLFGMIARRKPKA